MPEFKISNHIYKIFWTETFIRIMFGLKLIEEHEKYQNNQIPCSIWI